MADSKLHKIADIIFFTGGLLLIPALASNKFWLGMLSLAGLSIGTSINIGLIVVSKWEKKKVAR